jgi:hypothetical protein
LTPRPRPAASALKVERPVGPPLPPGVGRALPVRAASVRPVRAPAPPRAEAPQALTAELESPSEALAEVSEAPPADGRGSPGDHSGARLPDESAEELPIAAAATTPGAPAEISTPDPGSRSGAGEPLAPEVAATPGPAPLPAPIPLVAVTRPPKAGIWSATPRDPVPRPRLPRVYTPMGQDDLERVMGTIEDEAVKAGCSAAFARGITDGASQWLSSRAAAEVYPAATYYFIVREAALGREKVAASQALGKAYRTGVLPALNRLPAEERSRL